MVRTETRGAGAFRRGNHFDSPQSDHRDGGQAHAGGGGPGGGQQLGGRDRGGRAPDNKVRRWRRES